MAAEELKLLLRDYGPDGTFLKIKNNRDVGKNVEDCIEYALTLEPRRSMSIGLKNSDLMISGGSAFFEDMKYLTGKGGRFGEIYYKKGAWLYHHTLKPTEPGSSGLVALTDDGVELSENQNIILTAGKSIGFKVRRRRYGEIEETGLVTLIIA